MSFQATNAPTRIQPVGTYNPVRRLYPTAPQPPAPQPGGGFNMPDVHVPAGVKNFFGDVWGGSVDQLKNNGKRVLNPIDTARNVGSYLDKSPKDMVRAITNPYTSEIKAGRAGRAVGKLLANVVTLGGVVLGGRFLLGKVGIGGGANVGFSGPIGNFFSGVGNVVGAVTRPITRLVSGVFHTAGNVVRWLLPGGGPSVGFR